VSKLLAKLFSKQYNKSNPIKILQMAAFLPILKFLMKVVLAVFIFIFWTPQKSNLEFQVTKPKTLKGLLNATIFSSFFKCFLICFENALNWTFLSQILRIEKTCLCLFDRDNNKNCLGSFQVLWNKNCTTEKEDIIMKKFDQNKVN
jgi:hypothetical protein